jgi:hypothetical protein
MKGVKLALRARFFQGTFPPTDVRIGVDGNGAALMAISAHQNGNGPQQVRTFNLKQAEVDRILKAINDSHFWQLPHEPRLVGDTGGTRLEVDISIPELRNTVSDSMGNSDAVDLSVLGHVLGEVTGNHWQKIPGSEN